MIPKNNDMRFENSTKCNYKCIICSHYKLSRKKEITSFDLFKKIFGKIIKETSQYTTLTFPGMGEPLLDKSLEKKIHYAKKIRPNLSILLLTNGSLLTPQRFKSLESLGLSSVRVSLYGNTPKNYAKVHGLKNSNLFIKIKNNLLEIVRIKKTTELLLTYNVVENVNGEDVKGWINEWQDKVDLLEVWKPHNWVDGMNFRRIQKEKLKTCGRPFYGPLQIQVDGTVNMCCFDYDGKLTLGDLKEQSLKEIFSSAIFKKICGCHKTGNFKGSRLICENCDQRNADKSDVMIYNSRFDINERIQMTSTTYKKITQKGV